MFDKDKTRYNLRNFIKLLLKFKGFLDLIYQVEVDELGINALVQNIHLLSDCDEFGGDFPWHNQMIVRQCAKLRRLLKSASAEQKIDLVIGLFHIPGSAVRALLHACLNGISSETFLVVVMKQLMNKQYCQDLANNVPTFLSEG